MLRKKTVAFLVLLVVMANAFYVVSETLTTAPVEPFSLCSFIEAFGKTAVAYADPVPGGGGSGGDH